MPVSPFGPEDLARIRASLKELEEALQLAELATRAGFDVQDLKNRIQEQQTQLIRIRSVFFPGE